MVETIDYQPGESGNFPPPTTPEEVGKRVLLQDRIEDGDEMEVTSDEETQQDKEKKDDTGVTITYMQSSDFSRWPRSISWWLCSRWLESIYLIEVSRLYSE